MLTLEPSSKYPAPPMCGGAPCVSTFSGSGLYGKQLVNPPLKDWAPRAGFAYALTKSIAVRAGFTPVLPGCRGIRNSRVTAARLEG